MRFTLLILLSFFMLSATHPGGKSMFKEEQLSYSRVKTAYQERWKDVKALLSAADIDSSQFEVFIRGFKFEEDLEVWAKDSNMDTFKLVTSYKWCTNVGMLGPKRKEGDKQIPEGVYHLSKFNPESAFHLSLKVNYPNKSDSILGYRAQLGGMIFIHGGCKTIGCIPITDQSIEELYLFCLQATHYGQERIPIHLLPARLNDENFNLLKDQYKGSELLDFWSDLQVGYKLFEQNKTIPVHRIDQNGRYHFQAG